MSLEKPTATAKQESTQEILPKNPNNIGELFSFTKDIETTSDNVYRSVLGTAAITDLFESGIIRNRQAAGKVENNRWGTTVYWSRGAEGKYTNVQPGGYVIVAPYDIASQREVRKEDVTAIYGRNEAGEIEDIFPTGVVEKSEENSKVPTDISSMTPSEQANLNAVRSRLGLDSKE